MSSITPHILLITAGPRVEFESALAEMRHRADVVECASAASAMAYLARPLNPPDLVLICQARPGEFDNQQLDDLSRLAPLARFVVLLGSWCEGETRTGDVWPVATRLFWYEWPGELRRNLPAIAENRWAPWLAPATTLQDERYLPMRARCGAPNTELELRRKLSSQTEPLVLVSTRRSSLAEAICTACRQAGFAAIWQRPDRQESIFGLSAIIWEGIQLRDAETAELQRLAATWPESPILALADFPRWETRQRAIAAGARAVLAKPFSLEDLLAQLSSWCLPQTDTSADHAA